MIDDVKHPAPSLEVDVFAAVVGGPKHKRGHKCVHSATDGGEVLNSTQKPRSEYGI